MLQSSVPQGPELAAKVAQKCDLSFSSSLLKQRKVLRIVNQSQVGTTGGRGSADGAA